jgi:hypothetical protein
MKKINKILTIVLCIAMLFVSFGCASSSTISIEDTNNEEEVTNNQTEETLDNTNNNTSVDKTNQEEAQEEIVIDNSVDDENQLDDVQLNSIAMLNFLAYTTEKIRQSQNNRLYLEEVYSALMNDTYPNAINERTQAYMTSLFYRIEDLRIAEVKRDRLKYLYEQNKSSAIMNALPSPLSVLNVIQSGDPIKMVASLAYLAVDSATSYVSAVNNADISYLQDEWELDDTGAEIINSLRIEAFDYLNDTVRENKLEGDYALNEESIEYLVKLENNTNTEKRIQLLKDNENTYKYFGYYWLILSRSYYDKKDYENCVKAIETYLQIQPRIFRNDVQLANTLPMAIASLKEVYSGDELINKENQYLDLLLENTSLANSENDNWSLKYFAAIAYLELYKETSDQKYLQIAYEQSRNNVYNLIDEQNDLNTNYLEDVEELETSKNATKDKKKQIKEYNKSIKKQRETELPHISGSLIANLRLMFSIAEILGIDESEKISINKALHENDKNLFLDDLLDIEYWYSKTKDIKAVCVFDGSKLKIRANYLCDDSIITLSIKNSKETVTINDWTVSEVKRDGDDVSDFIASFESKTIEKADFNDGDIVEINIYPYQDYYEPYVIKYKVSKEKTMWFFDSIKFNLIS